MQEKKRIPLKRLHRLRNARKQAAETDDLTPMMKAIKAVHSVTSTGSTQPEDLERQRAAQELFGRLVTPNLLINTTPITVNNVSAEWVRMNQGHDRRHVVLYCHGGGYTCGQLGYARVLASKLALSTGCDVLSFEYRLAPEAPYPSAIDDALRVWDYLMYMGIGARDVIVAGDSAGGNLALELALAVKAQGRSQPCALVLMSPWTDMTMQGASYQKCAALDPMLTHDYIDSCRTAYRGANSTLEWEDPSLSPLFADLKGAAAHFDPGGNERNIEIRFYQPCQSHDGTGSIRRAGGIPRMLACVPADADPPCRTGHGKHWPLCAENFVTAEPRRIGGLPFARNLV